MERYNVSLRRLLQQGISEPEFYSDLVYRIRKIVGKSNFAEQFRKLINRYKRIGYNPYTMRQTACLAVNPVTVDSYMYVSLFNCTTVVWASDNDGLFVKLSQVGWGLMLCLCLCRRGSTGSQWVYRRFSQEYLSLFHRSDQFEFVSSLWCID